MSKVTVAALNLDSDTGKKILELEKLMNDSDIKITGSYLQLEIGEERFFIGRDKDCFPRFIDEPFWRYI